MYQIILFDLYGTLVDIHTNEQSSRLWRQIAQLYSAHGAFYTPAELKRSFRHFEALEQEKLTAACPEPNILNVFAELFKAKSAEVSPEVVRCVAYAFRIISRAYVRLYPGVTELLSQLHAKGRKIYLLSNAQEVFTQPELELLHLPQYFDGIFLSSVHQCKKPDPEYFYQLAKTYDLRPEECIMVGNDVHDDIGLANAAGIDSLYIHSNLSGKVTGPVPSTFQIMDGDVCKIAQLLGL